MAGFCAKAHKLSGRSIGGWAATAPTAPIADLRDSARDRARRERSAGGHAACRRALAGDHRRRWSDGQSARRRHAARVSGIAAPVVDPRRPLHGSAARDAIESGLPILIEDSVNDPRINQKLRAAVGDRSLICVPLFHGSKVIGTLNVMSRSEPQLLGEGERDTIEMLSVVLSATVSQAAAFDGRVVEANPALERDPDGRPAFAVTMIENITKRTRAEAELVRQAELSERQALHDPLTGLPNRLPFDDRIERAIALAEREGQRLAVAMLDLDRFKEISDSLGHKAGLERRAQELPGCENAA